MTKHAFTLPGRKPLARLLIAALPLLLLCCTSGPDLFEDLADRDDLEFVAYTGDNIWYLIDSFGAGLAAGDYDDDGKPDLLLLTGSAITAKDQEKARSHTNALWRNEGDTMSDRTASAGVGSTGWSNGAVFADYDGDGDLDIFVARHGPNELWRNNGDGTFTDMAEQAGVTDSRWTTTGSFADFDGDGDLDLYIVNYCLFDIEEQADTVHWFTIKQFPHYFDPQENVLFRNNGDGTFTDVTAMSGPEGVAGTGRSLMVMATDYDNDFDLDILVCNDIGPNDLYRNDGTMHFENIGVAAGFGTDAEGNFQASMGIAAGDIDFDGDLDYLTSHYGGEYHTLYLNDGRGGFTDNTVGAGLVNQMTIDTVCWGTGFHDLDLDGNLDLFLVAGHVITDFVRRGMLWHWGEDAEYLDEEEYIEENPQMADKSFNLGANQPKLLFLGKGDGTFVDFTESAGATLAEGKMSRGAAFADYDNDGRLDVAVSNKNQAAQVLLNRIPRKGRWVKIDLRADAPNHFAVGARLHVRAAGRTHIREIHAGTSYCSGSDYVVHVGLGDVEQIDEVEVRWPDGEIQKHTDLEVDSTYRITQGHGEARSLYRAPRTPLQPEIPGDGAAAAGSG